MNRKSACDKCCEKKTSVVAGRAAGKRDERSARRPLRLDRNERPGRQTLRAPAARRHDVERVTLEALLPDEDDAAAVRRPGRARVAAGRVAEASSLRTVPARDGDLPAPVGAAAGESDRVPVRRPGRIDRLPVAARELMRG